MTKKEILNSGYRHNAGPNMKGFYRILILWFVLLALCILWVHMDHVKADQKLLFSFVSSLHPSDEEIASKIISLASVRDTLTDTDCAEIDAEVDAWIDAHATHRIEDCSERVKTDNGIVAQSLGRAEQYAHHLDILEGQQR